MEDMQEFLADFRSEAGEALDRIQTMTLAMESIQNGNNEAVNAAFRAAHSIKGGAAFLDFTRLRTVAHAFEDLLDRIRSGALTPSSGITDILLHGIDSMREMVARSDGGEELPIEPILERIFAAGGVPAPDVPPENVMIPGHPSSPSLVETPRISAAEGSPLRVATDCFHPRHKEKVGTFCQFLIEHDLLKADEVVMAMIQQEEATPHPLVILRELQGLDGLACVRVLALARAKRIPLFQAAGELELLPITAVEELERSRERMRPSLGQAIVWLKLSSPAQVLSWFKRYVGLIKEAQPEPEHTPPAAVDVSMF